MYRLKNVYMDFWVAGIIIITWLKFELIDPTSNTPSPPYLTTP